jgi:hypothetical protein
MSVHYQERLSAAGRTRYKYLSNAVLAVSYHPFVYFIQSYSIFKTESSGGFFKREGRAKDHEVHYKILCSILLSYLFG